MGAMPSIEFASAIESVSLRALWTFLSMAYFAAATVLVMSRHDYPLWTWSTFYVGSVGILIFFNINYYAVAPIMLTFAELLLWLVGVFCGTTLFAILLLIGNDMDAGIIELPSSRELPRFAWRWAMGHEDDMNVGFAVCSECGHICRANIPDDGTVRPLGINECPECGHTGWQELVDPHKTWDGDEE